MAMACGTYPKPGPPQGVTPGIRGTIKDGPGAAAANSGTTQGLTTTHLAHRQTGGADVDSTTSSQPNRGTANDPGIVQAAQALIHKAEAS